MKIYKNPEIFILNTKDILNCVLCTSDLSVGTEDFQEYDLISDED